MRVASLFSGIGGFELGLSRAGFETVMMCENDLLARSVLHRRFPGIPVRSDVKNIKRLPKCEMLTAGWPCQDLSQAGRTAGIEGHRSGLISEVFRVLEAAKDKPEFVLLENVAFALHLQRGAALKYVTSNLERLGYKWAYRILDSRQFGVPQRRRRVFILGSRSLSPQSILFRGAESAGSQSTTPPELFGFYWTEGNTGLGWSPEAVPPLKGGSALSIPSPPAIWNKRTHEFTTPGISDTERMQGLLPVQPCFSKISFFAYHITNRAQRPRLHAADCPTGKSPQPRHFPLSSSLYKNISVFQKLKSRYMSSRPASHEGRFAIVSDARRDAVDAEAPITNGAEADGEIVWS
jgi:DNA (cytosine-5)-methyltransferase 1